MSHHETSSGGHRVLSILGRCFVVLLVTILLLAFALYGVMFVLAKGPSLHARNLFIMSVRETSAVGWLANLYCSQDEIAQIEAGKNVQSELEDTDTSLVQVGQGADDYGLIDDNGDGLILESITGPGYMGYLLVVLDPSRMMMGTPEHFGGRGLTVEEMVTTYDCIAGTNGGGFLDEGGHGTGGDPDSMVVVNGVASYGTASNNFVGFDADYILHTGPMTAAEAKEAGIQFGCSFGPVLIANGEPNSSAALISGVNPRTAIGQRADGAVLLLVIEGRQAHSLGATYSDLMDIMLEYGAVNACNLDGGSSSMLWLDGTYVNRCASVVGIRPVPTAFLVKKEGVK